MVTVPTGLYGSFYGGWSMPKDPTASFTVNPNTVQGNVNVSQGYRFGGSIGYDFSSNVAVEAELAYMHSNVSTIDVGAPVNLTLPAPGTGSALLLMGNVVVGEHFGSWRPYIGGGIGAARVSLDVDFMSGIHDSDWAFAGQVFTGIDYALSDKVTVGARYRYQHIGSTNYTDGNSLPVGLSEIGAHSIEFGLKFSFGG